MPAPSAVRRVTILRLIFEWATERSSAQFHEQYVSLAGRGLRCESAHEVKEGRLEVGDAR